jgi:hypothetical protein
LKDCRGFIRYKNLFNLCIRILTNFNFLVKMIGKFYRNRDNDYPLIKEGAARIFISDNIVKSKSRLAPMARRNFLLGVTVSLAALGSLRGWQNISTQVSDYFRRPEAARRIGKRLLMTGANSNVSPDGILDLEQRHLDDLEQGKIIVVDGWICSRSEVETCIHFASSAHPQRINSHAG